MGGHTKTYILIVLMLLFVLMGFQSVKAQCSTCYVERIGVTFSYINAYTNLTYNVIAVPQRFVGGYGPAYMLNGLSNTGFWYQVGISYYWNGPESQPGFYMDYEIWSPTGTSLFPENGFLGELPFSCTVNPYDIISISLKFYGGYVYMTAVDTENGCSASLSYNSERATYFIGNSYSAFNNDGFFTGLMTMWQSTSPQYNAQNIVTYSSTWVKTNESQNVPPTGIVWIDEYHANLSDSILYDSYPSSVSSASISYQLVSASYDDGIFTTGSIAPSPLMLSSSYIPYVTADGSCLLSPSVTISGGVPPYTYTLLINSTPVYSNTSFYTTYSFDQNCAGEKYGSYTYEIEVEDSTAELLSTPSGTLYYATPPVAHLILFPEIDVNHIQNVTLNLSEGVPPYAVNINLDGINYGNKTIFNFTKPGIHTMYVNATDKYGIHFSSGVYEFTVNYLPTISIFHSRTHTNADFGIDFTLNVTDGSMPYNISWYEDNLFEDNHFLGYGPTIKVVPPSNLTFNVYAKLVDADNYSIETPTLLITSNSALKFSSYKISSYNAFFYSNGTVKGEINATGGTPPYTYEWYVNNVLYAPATTPTYTFNFGNGENSVYGVVIDSLGDNITGSVYSSSTGINYVNVYLTAGISVAAVIAALYLLRKIRGRFRKARITEMMTNMGGSQ